MERDGLSFLDSPYCFLRGVPGRVIPKSPERVGYRQMAWICRSGGGGGSTGPGGGGGHQKIWHGLGGRMQSLLGRKPRRIIDASFTKARAGWRG